MGNSKNCIKYRNDYDKLLRMKADFDVKLEEIQSLKKKLQIGNISKINRAIQEAKFQKQNIKEFLKHSMRKNLLFVSREKLGLAFRGECEGKEIGIDLVEQIEYWNNFYQKYQITDRVGNICQISNDLRLTEEAISRAKECIKQYGFNQILMVPEGISIMRSLMFNKEFSTYNNNNIKKIDKIENEEYFHENQICVMRSVDYDKQNFEPRVVFLKNKNYLDDIGDLTVKKFKAKIKKLMNKFPYNDDFLEMKKKICDNEICTRNLSRSSVKNMEKLLELDGLTDVQALILDRVYFDQNEKHLFYFDKNATWLDIESGRAYQGSIIGWDSVNQVMRIDSRDNEFCDDNVGYVFACKLEVKEKDD